jgi:hypothetical protein
MAIIAPTLRDMARRENKVLCFLLRRELAAYLK